MHSISTTKAKNLSNIIGACVSVVMWGTLISWIIVEYRHFQSSKNELTSEEAYQLLVEAMKEQKVETPQSTQSTEIEQFRPQLNTSTWGEVEEIINSFKAEMKQCESYDGENKIACYDHYKTQFWRKMDSEVKTRN